RAGGCGTKIATFCIEKECGQGAAWPWTDHGPWAPLPAARARRFMSSSGYACCRECGRKLHTTFFCQECGQPSCCLDGHCRHEARPAGEQQAAQPEHQAEGSTARLEPAR